MATSVDQFGLAIGFDSNDGRTRNEGYSLRGASFLHDYPGSPHFGSSSEQTCLRPGSSGQQIEMGVVHTRPDGGPGTDAVLWVRCISGPTEPHARPDQQLSPGGVGGLEVGMSVAQVAAVAGVSIVVEPPRHPGDACQSGYLGLGGGVSSPRFTLVDGAVAVFHASVSMVTDTGIHLGSTEAAVKAAYSGVTEEPNPFAGRGPIPDDSRYLVFTPNDPESQHLAMLFQVDGGRVAAMKAGLVDYVRPSSCP